MKDDVFEFTLPMDLYEQASEVLAKQGLTVEDALVLLFEYVARTGKLPFEIQKDGDEYVLLY